MIENFLKEIRSLENLNSAIVSSIVLEREKNLVTVKLITDKAFTEADRATVLKTVRKYVPEIFECAVEISKLTDRKSVV